VRAPGEAAFATFELIVDASDSSVSMFTVFDKTLSYDDSQKIAMSLISLKKTITGLSPLTLLILSTKKDEKDPSVVKIYYLATLISFLKWKAEGRAKICSIFAYSRIRFL
jgi:hypothetical protein